MNQRIRTRYIYNGIDFPHCQTKNEMFFLYFFTEIYFCRGQVGIFWDVMYGYWHDKEHYLCTSVDY